MDQAFFDELDRQISEIGTEEVWKKTVGNRLIWLSPVSMTGQGKVQAAMAENDPIGYNVFEAKKVTLSRAIVGVDNIDLRLYKKSGPVFKVFDPRVGEKVSVDLPAYLLNKLADWGHEFVDVTFDIFADLMESHRKALLKDTVFENIKDPKEELAELQDKVSILREQLNLPPLVEFNPDAMPAPDTADELKDTDRPGNAFKDEVAPETDFDPFRHVPEAPKPAPAMMEPLPPPVRTVPVPVASPVPQKTPAQEALRRHQAIAASESSPETPFQAIPSVPSDVIETRFAGKSPVPPPPINPISKSINPRFQPPKV